jgi:hypothetical protein
MCGRITGVGAGTDEVIAIIGLVAVVATGRVAVAVVVAVVVAGAPFNYFMKRVYSH